MFLVVKALGWGTRGDWSWGGSGFWGFGVFGGGSGAFAVGGLGSWFWTVRWGVGHMVIDGWIGPNGERAFFYLVYLGRTS